MQILGVHHIEFLPMCTNHQCQGTEHFLVPRRLPGAPLSQYPPQVITVLTSITTDEFRLFLNCSHGLT